MTKISSWLKKKLIKGDNGIILSTDDCENFNTIQEFIENRDLCFQTPVIYFQALSLENTINFLQNLQGELMSKLSGQDFKPQETLENIIEIAKLEMIIIDRCYLYSFDTLQNLIDFFNSNNVTIILVGSQKKIENAQILDMFPISQWEQLTTCAR